MDKIQKLLKRLGQKEFKAVFEALQKIKTGNVASLNIKKLTGHTNIYRARVQDIRIIFLANKERIEILDISRRSEKTYRDF